MRQEIITLQPELVPHHEIASLHRDMSDMEFESLKLDIESNGQLLPIITYRDKLVDGRHRQRALIELGIHDMLAIALPNNTSLEDVKAKVIGTEMRRTDNVAQKSIRAFKWMNESGTTQQEAATKFAITQGRVSEAKKLMDVVGSNTVEKLYNNGYLILGGKKHTRISTILKFLSTTEEEQKGREPINEQVKDMFEQLQTMFNTGDIAGIAQVESIAKSLRMKDV